MAAALSVIPVAASFAVFAQEEEEEEEEREELEEELEEEELEMPPVRRSATRTAKAES